MMTKPRMRQVIKEIAKHEKTIGAERDRLDKFIDDLTDLRCSCDDAIGLLEDARDALSRLL